MKYYLPIIILAICVALFVAYRFFTSREGFQVTPSTSGTKPTSPTACMMMKVVVEKMTTNIDKVTATNDAAAIKNAKNALESVKTEMTNAGCT